MNTAVAVKKEAVATVGAALEKMKPQLQAVLPKHITPERMVRVAMVAIQNTPKLLDCDRNSLYVAVLRAAQLGLEPDGILGQAYLIPYGKQVQFIPGYRGLIDLARRSGDLSNLIAKEVCKNDDFKIQWHKSPPFEHNQKAEGDRGEVIGFWALAYFKDGGFHWDYLTVQEVLAIRDKSSGWQTAKKYNSTEKSPWHAHFVEMGKKTAIRRIAKYLPMSVQKASAFETLQDDGHKVSFDGGELVIEETGEIIEGETVEGGSAKLDNFAGEHSKAAEATLAEREAKKPELTEDEMNRIDAEEAARDEGTPSFLKVNEA